MHIGTKTTHMYICTYAHMHIGTKTTHELTNKNHPHKNVSIQKSNIYIRLCILPMWYNSIPSVSENEDSTQVTINTSENYVFRSISKKTDLILPFTYVIHPKPKSQSYIYNYIEVRYVRIFFKLTNVRSAPREIFKKKNYTCT
jgi:hypothetical protein